MPWVRKEDTYPRHRKIRRLNDAQYRMHDEAIHWCAEHLTDGHVPADELDDVTVVKNPRRHVPTLIQRGLWHAAGHDCPRCLQPSDPKGWVIHDYLEYNPTRLEVQAERARKREAGRRGGRASAAVRRASQSVPEVPEAEGKQAASAPASALLSEGAEHPSRPDPTRTRRTPPAGAATAPITALGIPEETTTAQTIVGEWIDRCAKRPPGDVIGQIGKRVATMLGEGTDPDDVRRGMAAWHAKGLHPSSLPSVVNEVMNGAPTARRESTTDARVGAALELAARFAAEEATTQNGQLPGGAA
jgi:hypothetical protein